MVDLGTDLATGRRRRLHLRGGTKAEVIAKVRRAQQGQSQPGNRQRVSDWLGTWLDVIARTSKPSTLRTYRTHVGYALSSFGAVRLGQPSPRTPGALLRRPCAPRGATHKRAEHTRDLALGVRGGNQARAPARQPGTAGPPAPRPSCRGRPPLAQRGTRRAGSRFKRAQQRPVALGARARLRQGEALGLCWEDIDLEAGTLSVRRALCRAPWLHGCAPTRPCGTKPSQPSAPAVQAPAASALRQSGLSTSRVGKAREAASPGTGWGMRHTGAEYDDSGGASRFFHAFTWDP